MALLRTLLTPARRLRAGVRRLRKFRTVNTRLSRAAEENSYRLVMNEDRIFRVKPEKYNKQKERVRSLVERRMRLRGIAIKANRTDARRKWGRRSAIAGGLGLGGYGAYRYKRRQ